MFQTTNQFPFLDELPLFPMVNRWAVPHQSFIPPSLFPKEARQLPKQRLTRMKTLLYGCFMVDISDINSIFGV